MTSSTACPRCAEPPTTGYVGDSCMKCGLLFKKTQEIDEREILADAAAVGFGSNMRSTHLVKIIALYRRAFEKGRKSCDS